MSELTEDDLLDFLLTARRDKKRLGLDVEKTAAVFKDGIK